MGKNTKIKRIYKTKDGKITTKAKAEKVSIVEVKTKKRKYTRKRKYTKKAEKLLAASHRLDALKIKIAFQDFLITLHKDNFDTLVNGENISYENIKNAVNKVAPGTTA